MANNYNLQSNQATNVVSASPLKEILTIEEAAEFLSVLKSYLYKQTSAQAIPPITADRQTVLLQAQ